MLRRRVTAISVSHHPASWACVTACRCIFNPNFEDTNDGGKQYTIEVGRQGFTNFLSLDDQIPGFNPLPQLAKEKEKDIAKVDINRDFSTTVSDTVRRIVAARNNRVLSAVFAADPDKDAVCVEQLPPAGGSSLKAFRGQEPKVHVALRKSYGELQADVVRLAQQLKRVQDTCGCCCFSPASGGGKKETEKEDFAKNTALLFPHSSGYSFTVALLSAWLLGRTAVPMCPTHAYGTEMAHMLQHSRAPMMLSDLALAKQKLPASFSADCVWNNPQEEQFPLPQQHHYVTRNVSLTGNGYFERTFRTTHNAPAPTHLSSAMSAEEICLDECDEAAASHHDDCLMIYTSGTTAKPKGVVHTHASVSAQVDSLLEAWRWSNEDVILNNLPLHHVHGLVNVLCCSLAANATCVFSPFDNPGRIARRIAGGDINLYMAVPTIYSRLIDSVTNTFSDAERFEWKQKTKKHLRLMVSGSAPLPVPVLTRFEELSGHRLLERYGMTELGMALGQPVEPISLRVPATVGVPFPGVEAVVRPVDDDDTTPVAEEQNKKMNTEEEGHAEVGELCIRSPMLFDRYFDNPQATQSAFTVIDGNKYFMTGDTVATLDVPTPTSDGGNEPEKETTRIFKILGRTSVDILKRAGYKLSALEIEASLLESGLVQEVAVVGVADQDLGEKVCAIVVPNQEALKRAAAEKRRRQKEQGEGIVEKKEKSEFVEQLLHSHMSEAVAKYKRPDRYVLLMDSTIPRNAMGKINKKELVKTLGVV